VVLNYYKQTGWVELLGVMVCGGGARLLGTNLNINIFLYGGVTALIE